VLCHIYSRPAAGRSHSVAAAVSLILGVAGQVQAQDSAPKALPKISVQGQEATNKIDQVSSPKFTQPLLDTPQTITIVGREVLQQQGVTTLSQALRNTPGVTFLLGENGNTATGDSIFMRGFDTQGSIFIDGIRDLGTISRDTFNAEQIEIAKGPAGPDYGRGAASGYVNLASKVPVAENFSQSLISYGTADNGRITSDLNQFFDGANAAFRINVMAEEGGVDGRDEIEREGWAVAPSLAFGLGGPTRAYFYLLHTEQDNRPDGGVPTIGLDGFFSSALASAGIVASKVDRDNFYGALSDFEDIEATMFTARIEHDFSSDVKLKNTSRYGKSEQFYVLTGVNAITIPALDPATWTVARTRQTKSQENTLLTNQTNVTAAFKTGAIEHSLTGGVEFIYEKQFNPAYAGSGTMAPAGSAAGANFANLYNPNPQDPVSGLALARTAAFTKGDTFTAGAYVFDTINLTERWELTGGVRLDDFNTQFDSVALSTLTSNPTLPVNTPVPTELEASDTLVSYKVGVLFKPMPNGSVYISHATSQQPPGGTNFTLNAGTPNVTTGAVNINTPNLDPQEATNLEVGAKWDLRDGALALTGAVFRSENKNDLAQVDPTDPSAIQQYGKKRVEGIELGIVGQITDVWQITAGLAKMDTEVVAGTATQTGAQINWSPELTFTSWTTYQLPFGLTIGGGVRYVDTVFRQINNGSAPGATPASVPSAPDYWVIDAVAAYTINDRFTVQLNGYNLADEQYIATLNNSGARYSPGAPRSGLLTVSVNF
jgi:catecholate siderophore receptor